MLKSIGKFVSPIAADALISKFPIKRRPALWFFRKHVLGKKRRWPRGQVREAWTKINPELKQPFYEMEKLDWIRYNEETSRWVQEATSILAKDNDSLANDLERLLKISEPEYHKCLDDAHKTPSHDKSKIMLPDAFTIESLDQIVVDKDIASALDNFISNIPEQDHQDQNLSLPKKPNALVIYFRENIDQLKKEFVENNFPHKSLYAFAAKKWSKMSDEEKKVYKEQSIKECPITEKAPRLKSASQDDIKKESAAFLIALRRILRRHNLFPRRYPNQFTMFVKEGGFRNFSECAEQWRSMSVEEKEYYVKKYERDRERYKEERDKFENSTPLAAKLSNIIEPNHLR